VLCGPEQPGGVSVPAPLPGQKMPILWWRKHLYNFDKSIIKCAMSGINNASKVS